jgi:hypothetical protein
MKMDGDYAKVFEDDRQSMASGVVGWKGHVHVTCAPPLRGEYQTPKDVAHALDQAIVSGYIFFPSNYFAYEALHGTLPQGDCYYPERPFDAGNMRAEREVFDKHMQQVPHRYRNYVLHAYANPLLSKLELTGAVN